MNKSGQNNCFQTKENHSEELKVILELWNDFGSHFEKVHDSKTA